MADEDLKPGKALDAKIASLFYGVGNLPSGDIFLPGLGCGTPHPFSSSHDMALKLLEEFEKKFHEDVFEIRCTLSHGRWICSYLLYSDSIDEFSGDTLPYAICLMILYFCENVKGVK